MVSSKWVPVAHGIRTKTSISVQTMYEARSNGSLKAWISGDLKTSSEHGFSSLDNCLSGAEAIGLVCPYDSYDDDDSYDL